MCIRDRIISILYYYYYYFSEKMASAYSDELTAKNIQRQERRKENERFEAMNQEYWQNNIWKPMMKKEEGGEKKKEEEEEKKKKKEEEKKEEKKMSPEDRFDFDVERARCLMERKQLLLTQAARRDKWRQEKGYTMPTELDQEKEEEMRHQRVLPCLLYTSDAADE